MPKCNGGGRAAASDDVQKQQQSSMHSFPRSFSVSRSPEEAVEEAKEFAERMELESTVESATSPGPASVCMRVALGVSVALQFVVFITSLALTWEGTPPVAESWVWVGGVTSTGFEARVRGGGG
eukprot:Hpha_TRINITY_DN31810_c0_g1::TRINITY_DN31810_c0_g1_i1::g.29987::m.29987